MKYDINTHLFDFLAKLQHDLSLKYVVLNIKVKSNLDRAYFVYNSNFIYDLILKLQYHANLRRVLVKLLSRIYP